MRKYRLKKCGLAWWTCYLLAVSSPIFLLQGATMLCSPEVYAQEFTEPVIETRTIEDVPDKDVVNIEEVQLISRSAAKTYMSVWKITDRSSKQWKYIHESGAVEIDQDGFLICDGEYIGVALGSYFGDIGSKYIFHLDSGEQLKLCKVDEKADCHTIDGFYHAVDGSVIEFVVDPEADYMQRNIAANGYIFSGNFNNCERFGGEIAKIEKVVE